MIPNPLGTFLVNSLRGFVMSMRWGMNLLRYWVRPNRCCTVATSVGCGISSSARILEGSIWRFFPVEMCPIKGTSCNFSLTFSAFNLTSCSWHLFTNASRLFSWPRVASSVTPKPTTTYLGSLLQLFQSRLLRTHQWWPRCCVGLRLAVDFPLKNLRCWADSKWHPLPVIPSKRGVECRKVRWR